jgi:hypothetical protein
VRAELRDFQGLEQKRGRGKNIIAALLIIGAIAAAVNGFYFGLPHQSTIVVSDAGDGVLRIDCSGSTAVVTVSGDWAAHAEARAHILAGVLRDHGVKKALLLQPSGATVGTLDMATGKLGGLPRK